MFQTNLDVCNPLIASHSTPWGFHSPPQLHGFQEPWGGEKMAPATFFQHGNLPDKQLAILMFSSGCAKDAVSGDFLPARSSGEHTNPTVSSTRVRFFHVYCIWNLVSICCTGFSPINRWVLLTVWERNTLIFSHSCWNGSHCSVNCRYHSNWNSGLALASSK